MWIISTDLQIVSCSFFVRLLNLWAARLSICTFAASISHDYCEGYRLICTRMLFWIKNEEVQFSSRCHLVVSSVAIYKTRQYFILRCLHLIFVTELSPARRPRAVGSIHVNIIGKFSWKKIRSLLLHKCPSFCCFGFGFCFFCLMLVIISNTDICICCGMKRPICVVTASALPYCRVHVVWRVNRFPSPVL